MNTALAKPYYDPSDPSIDVNPVGEMQSLYKTVTTACYVDVAFGIEKPENVLRRYGFNDDDIRFLLNSDQFRVQVDRCRAELTSSGMMFKAKNAMLADSLMQSIYRQASDPQTPLAMKLEAYRTFAKFGGLEPQPSAQKGAIGGVSISINLSAGTGTQPQTITVTASQPDEQPEEDDFVVFDALPEQTPFNIKGLADFNFGDFGDLSGENA